MEPDCEGDAGVAGVWFNFTKLRLDSIVWLALSRRYTAFYRNVYPMNTFAWLTISAVATVVVLMIGKVRPNWSTGLACGIAFCAGIASQQIQLLYTSTTPPKESLLRAAFCFLVPTTQNIPLG